MKGQALRVDMELFQGCEVSARRNIDSYIPDCITSLMSIREVESSAGRLEGDHSSQGTKKNSFELPVQFRVSFSPSHGTKQARKGGPFPQGIKHLKGLERSQQDHVLLPL